MNEAIPCGTGNDCHLKPSHSILSVLCLLAASVILPGCGSSLKVETTRSRGLDLDPSSVIAVGRITGEYGYTFREELVSALKERGTFTVSGKRDDSVIGDPIAQETAQAIGNETGASVIVTGYLETSSSKDRAYVDLRTKLTGPDSGKWVIRYTWNANFHFRVIDLKKGRNRLVHSMSNVQGYQRDEATNIIEGILVEAASRTVFKLVESSNLKRTRSEIIDEFLRELTRYTEKVDVELRADDDLPELKEGIALARGHEWDKAIGVFTGVANKYPDAVNIDKAWFDLGVACEYSHRFDDARRYLQKALELNDDADYKNEIRSCTIFEQEYDSQMERAGGKSED